MQSEGKFRSMTPELYSASVSLTFAFGVGCGGWGTSCSASHKACIEMNCFLGVTMVPYSHHGNYTNTAFLRKQVQWSWLHILFFSFLSRAPWRVFLGQGRLPALCLQRIALLLTRIINMHHLVLLHRQLFFKLSGVFVLLLHVKPLSLCM